MSDQAPPTEVSDKATRRRFTAEYKRKMVREADACTERGALSAQLRREGLYSSHLATWRSELARSDLASLSPKKRGPKGKQVDVRDRRIAELERDVNRLKARLERAELIIDVQKKISSILGIPLPDSDENL
jgi:transposase